ncbi:MAG: NotI family restriction endonuclease [Chloroflexota bacterium]
MIEKITPEHPLAEVFGFPVSNVSEQAKRYRDNRLCPFNNRVPSCTKDKASDPLGVCSIFDDGEIAVTCPIRFRQDWIIAEDAASFFFPSGTSWTSLTEVRLNDRDGKSAGNIDVVLVSYNERGRVLEFGALEVQAVYISGNVRRPFEYYMEDPSSRQDMVWKGRQYYPRADYLSSSRKRLAPQLIFKGGILNAWERKIAVAMDKNLFQTLPKLEETTREEAEVAWLVYDLQPNPATTEYTLSRHQILYTSFETALTQISRPDPGNESEFIERLQTKLDEKLEDGNPPDAPTIEVEL